MVISAKMAIFVEKIAKIALIQSYKLHGCSARLDPFGFATALA